MKRPVFRRDKGGRGASGRQDGGPASLFTQAQIQYLVRAEFGRARRHGHGVALALLAIDRLHHLADLHGQELRVAIEEGLHRVVGEQTRNSDHVGRGAREQLLIVLPHTVGAAARQVVERIARALATLTFQVDGASVKVTLSAGIASTDDGQLLFDAVFSRAEKALASAAAAGDRIEVFGTDSG